MSLLGLTAVIWKTQSPPESEGIEISEARYHLVENVGEFRPSRGRFAGFSYAEYNPGIGSSKNSHRLSRVRQVRRVVEREIKNRRSPAAVGDLALLDLFAGKTDRAVDLMQEASDHDPSSAALASDLSAALLARGETRNRPSDLLLALAAAQRAVKASPRHEESRFNLALCLQLFSLIGQAQNEWNTYLRLDPQSPWADEARRHLLTLQGLDKSALWESNKSSIVEAASSRHVSTVRNIISSFRQQARIYVEEELLSDWAVAHLDGRDGDAERTLRTIREIGRALKEINSDPLIFETVAAIDLAISQSEHAALVSLAEGHIFYREGLDLLNVELDQQALAKFRMAEESLGMGNSVFRLRANLNVVLCRYNLGYYQDVLLERGTLEPRLARFPVASARLYWLLGLAHLKLSYLADALRLYYAALTLYREAEEIESVAALHCLIAENLRLLGETEIAWKHRYDALASGLRFGSRKWLHNVQFDSAEAARKQGLTEIALLFQTEMIESPLRMGDAISTVEALIRRGLTYAALAEYPKAEADLERARELLPRIGSPQWRQPRAADIEMVHGEVDMHEDPNSAAQHLSVAIEYHDSNGNYFRLPPLLYRRALAYVAAGRTDLAEQDLEAVIVATGAERKRIESEHLVIAYDEAVRSSFDAMVKLQVMRGREDEAFRFHEQSRTGSLQAMLRRRGTLGAAGKAPKVMTQQEVRERLPKRAAVIEYATLENTLCIWVLAANREQLIQLPIETERLRRIVARWRGMLVKGKVREAKVTASILYDVLIRPAGLDTAEVDTVIIIPDKVLHLVPFAALVDSRSGRYLIEDLVVGYSPSATFYAEAATRRRESRAAKSSRILLVGDPAFDPSLLEGLPRLRGAVREVRRIADLYEEGQLNLLLGEMATKQRFLESSVESDIIHLACHARINYETPSLSFLALAATREDAGLIYARDLYGIDFRRTKVVVLAACDTAGGRLSSTEGVLNFARPFLAAGVHAVIGSTWDINDAAAVEFFEIFHREIYSGADPLRALRVAQLQLIRSSDESLNTPASWAAFQVFGGSTNVFTPFGG